MDKFIILDKNSVDLRLDGSATVSLINGNIYIRTDDPIIVTYPIFKHDCGHCVYLGTVYNKTKTGEAYYCNVEKTCLVRTGNEPEEYLTGQHELVNKAKEIAKGLNLKIIG